MEYDPPTRPRSGPWRILFLIACIAGVLYVDRYVMPSTTAFFVPTATPTQSAESFTNQAEALFKEGKLRRRLKLQSGDTHGPAEPE